MKGLRIRITRSSNIILRAFKDIDFKDYDFDVTFWQSYEMNKPSGWIYFEEFDDIPSTLIKKWLLCIDDSDAAPEFLELFIRENKFDSKEIEIYKDFLESKYMISVLIADHRNLEICSKDEKILTKICENLDTYKEEIGLIQIRKIYKIDDNARMVIFAPKGTRNIDDYHE